MFEKAGSLYDVSAAILDTRMKQMALSNRKNAVLQRLCRTRRFYVNAVYGSRYTGSAAD